MIERVWAPRDSLDLISRGKWTAEIGPMLTHAARFSELGVHAPPWTCMADVTSADLPPQQILRPTAELSVAEIASADERPSKRGDTTRVATWRKRPASWVCDQFALAPKERRTLINCIHMLQPGDSAAPLAALPDEVEAANLSRHWWPQASTFVIFSMKGIISNDTYRA